MANTVEAETPAERRDRWQLLTANLQTNRLQDVPDDLLLDPLETTRTGVPLVAHYEKLRQITAGSFSYKEFVPLVLAVVVSPLFFSDSAVEALEALPWWIAVPAGTAWVALSGLFVLFHMYFGSECAPLTLNLQELTLTALGKQRHTSWLDVYAVRVVQNRSIRKRARVRVELNDGLVAKLHVPRDDCEPLADLMRALIVCHRGNH